MALCVVNDKKSCPCLVEVTFIVIRVDLQWFYVYLCFSLCLHTYPFCTYTFIVLMMTFCDLFINFLFYKIWGTISSCVFGSKPGIAPKVTWRSLNISRFF